MKTLKLALASAGALALAACSQAADDTAATADPAATGAATETETVTPAATDTIVQVAQGNPDFSTLVTAVTAAKLGETLSGPGPYTVFAPNNAAFAKVPAATLEALTTTQTAQLGDILKYHVVEGRVDAATLTKAIEGAGAEGYSVTTVGGGTLTAKVVDGKVVLTDATGKTSTVTATDVAASNGVIHVIDTVLMPK